MKGVYGLVVSRVRLPTIGRNQTWNPVSRSFMLGKISHFIIFLLFYVSYEIINFFDKKQVCPCLFAAKLRRNEFEALNFFIICFLGNGIEQCMLLLGLPKMERMIFLKLKALRHLWLPMRWSESNLLWIWICRCLRNCEWFIVSWCCMMTS